MKEILSKLVAGNNLTKEEAMRAQEMILSGKATQAPVSYTHLTLPTKA